MNLKIHNGLCGLFDSPRAWVWGGMHVRESVKKHDIHVKLESYNLEFLGELVI